jgi:hypothetical protein
MRAAHGETQDDHQVSGVPADVRISSRHIPRVTNPIN